MQSRIITLDMLRQEIGEYGISRLAREIGFSRQQVQRIASGQRKPSARFVEKVGYQTIVV
jgi:transcriptional regulator with XRE-family HTH domain